MMNTHDARPLTLLVVAAVALASPAPAQDAPKEPEKQPEKEPEQQEDDQTKADDSPSLDELLGLPDPSADAPPVEGDEGAPEKDITKKRLDEALDDAKDISDEFELALKEMDESADRLEYSLDTGPVTQRLQQSIIRRLEDLIEASQQQQSSSSSSQQSQSSQQQQPQQPQQAQQSNSTNPQGENQGERTPPGGPADAELRESLDTARASWGSLPERVRDALQQGSSDYFSRLYDSMTESYYKRLAEEGSDRK